MIRQLQPQTAQHLPHSGELIRREQDEVAGGCVHLRQQRIHLFLGKILGEDGVDLAGGPPCDPCHALGPQM